MKTVQEARQAYIKKFKQFEKDKFLLGLNNLSAGEKQAIKSLASLSHTVGGKENLASLVQIFMAIE